MEDIFMHGIDLNEERLEEILAKLEEGSPPDLTKK